MKSPRAFTLVEMLVVITIVVLLIAILLPSLRQAREQGRQVSCLSNMRQLSIADRLYLDSNAETYNWVFTSWQAAISPYLSSGGDPTVPGELSAVFHCPSDNLNEIGPFFAWGGSQKFSYQVNQRFYWDAPAPITWGFLSERVITRPSATVYRGDMLWSTIGTTFIAYPGIDIVNSLIIRNEMVWHGESMNLLYVDGHALSLDKDEVLDGMVDHWRLVK